MTTPRANIMAAPLSINMMTFAAARIVWGSPGAFLVHQNTHSKSIKKILDVRKCFLLVHKKKLENSIQGNRKYQIFV
jgi:hypothetical protein